MAKARFTPEAQQDIVRIGSYIAKENPAAALRWVGAIEGVCNLLAAQPKIGQRMQTRRFGEIRRHVAGSYLIYYRQLPNALEILAVVHGARDQGNLI